MLQKDNNLSKLYEKLSIKRDEFLDRGRECAELTLPAILPHEGFGSSDNLYTPYQSVGSRGVNNLASKLLLLLLPPNAPFFRLSLSGKVREELEQDPKLKTSVEKSLAKIEREVMNAIEQSALRVPVFSALKHLIITGNVLVHFPKEGQMKIYPLSQYCIKRDSQGSLLEIVIKESISPLSLSVEVRAACQVTDADEEIDLYTCIKKQENGKYSGYQECNKVEIPGSYGTYKEDDLPYIPLRMIRVDTEDYGRSYCEEFLGDLKSIEGLSKALLESAAASSKVVFMVRPNALTKKRDLVESNNGDIITGVKDDVSVLQTDKQYDLQIVERSINTIAERLSYDFLLQSAVTRDAERVTAEEIRKLANELESALGGIYSLLSQELQLPLVNLLMKRLSAKQMIPKLPKGSIQPTIITGVEALGRGNDLQKLREFVQDMTALASVNPQAAELININDLINRIATSHGIDTEGLIKDEEQIAQEQQQAQADQAGQAAIDQGMGPAIQGAVEGVRDGSVSPEQISQAVQQIPGGN